MRAVAAVLLLTGLGVLAGPAPSACACSCAAVSTAEHVRDADVVFTGVAGPLVAAPGWATPFTVDSTEKGYVLGTVTVHSIADNEAACGMRFDQGVRYRIYAKRHDGRLVTTLCSGNTPVAGQPSLRPLDDGETGRPRPVATWIVVVVLVAAVLAGATLRKWRAGQKSA